MNCGATVPRLALLNLPAPKCDSYPTNLTLLPIPFPLSRGTRNQLTCLIDVPWCFNGNIARVTPLPDHGWRSHAHTVVGIRRQTTDGVLLEVPVYCRHVTIYAVGTAISDAIADDDAVSTMRAKLIPGDGDGGRAFASQGKLWTTCRNCSGIKDTKYTDAINNCSSIQNDICKAWFHFILDMTFHKNNLPKLKNTTNEEPV